MADPTGSANSTNHTDVHTRTQQRRSNVIRRTVFLAVATVGLAAFVAGLGDVRRRDWAMSQCRWYSQALSDRLADHGGWPIDLEVDTEQKDGRESPAEMYKIKWLSRDEVQRLSDSDQSILVAWTLLVPRTIWPDGRACVVYQSKSFETIWLSKPEFTKRRTSQQAQ